MGEFRNKYHTMAFVFEPDQIYEGGIRMTLWPFSKPEEYKAIRFGAGLNVENRWPTDVRINALQEWKDDPKKVFAVSPEAKRSDYDGQIPVVTTTLRALYGAPCWTEEEVELVSRSFNKAGFPVVVPEKLELVKEGASGNPRESVAIQKQASPKADDVVEKETTGAQSCAQQ
jgi:hypothetical protein